VERDWKKVLHSVEMVKGFALAAWKNHLTSSSFHSFDSFSFEVVLWQQFLGFDEKADEKIELERLLLLLLVKEDWSEVVVSMKETILESICFPTFPCYHHQRDTTRTPLISTVMQVGKQFINKCSEDEWSGRL